MASLFKRGTIYYAAFCDAQRTPNRKQVSLGTKKREALKRLQELEERYRKGRYDPWVTVTLERGRDLGTLGAAKDAFIHSRANLRPTQ